MITIIVTLVVLGFIFWLVPMDPGFRDLALKVTTVLVVLWILGTLLHLIPVLR